MKLIKNLSLIKGIVMKLWGINNIFPVTKEKVACPNAIKST